LINQYRRGPRAYADDKLSAIQSRSEFSDLMTLDDGQSGAPTPAGSGATPTGTRQRRKQGCDGPMAVLFIFRKASRLYLFWRNSQAMFRATTARHSVNPALR
jgi:hypothetical protein